MKSLLPFFAFLILFRPFWPIVEYIVAYDYIIAEFCENKDKPELQCDGTCYLSKQLAFELQQENQNPLKGSAAKQDIPQIYILEDLPLFQLSILPNSGPKKIYFLKNLYPSSFVMDDIDPPRIA